MATPRTVPITVVRTPTNSEMRAPYRIRTNRSRPSSSAPSQNCLPGPTGTPVAEMPVLGNCWVGPWPVSAANAGAAMASPAMITITTALATAILSPRSRCQVSRHWLRPSMACTGASSAPRAWNSISVTLMLRPLCAAPPRPGGPPGSRRVRVQPDVSEVPSLDDRVEVGGAGRGAVHPGARVLGDLARDQRDDRGVVHHGHVRLAPHRGGRRRRRCLERLLDQVV